VHRFLPPNNNVNPNVLHKSHTSIVLYKGTVF
jgi:hypothetical protein